MWFLPVVYETQGRFADALHKFDDAYTILSKALGSTHSSTINAALRSSQIKSHKNEYLRQALAMYVSSLFARSLSLAPALSLSPPPSLSSLLLLLLRALSP